MGVRPRYRKRYYDDLDKEFSRLEIYSYILAVLLAISLAPKFVKWMENKPEPKPVPIVKVSKPVSDFIRPMNLSMGTATVKRIREAWYKVYFSVLNRDDKPFNGIIQAEISDSDRVTQVGKYPCSIAPGEDRLVTYFSSVKPTFVRIKVERMGLEFGAKFREIER
jgi:hypothetical protein